MCYVYLADVPSPKDGREVAWSKFEESSWFTRCWTLQELLAPRQRTFCTVDWGVWFLLEKIDEASQDNGMSIVWARELECITGIPAKLLYSHHMNLNSFSIAQKMSWAARRQATRREDVAYSLLGLFDVNMPLLYGEGSRAFRRLQLEIMKQSSDESIFVWMPSDGPRGRAQVFQLLATSPAHFESCGKTHNGGAPRTTGSSPYAMTNQGLDFRGLCYKVTRHSREEFILPLKCYEGNELATQRQWALLLLREHQLIHHDVCSVGGLQLYPLGEMKRLRAENRDKPERQLYIRELG